MARTDIVEVSATDPRPPKAVCRLLTHQCLQVVKQSKTSQTNDWKQADQMIRLSYYNFHSFMQ